MTGWVRGTKQVQSNTQRTPGPSGAWATGRWDRDLDVRQPFQLPLPRLPKQCSSPSKPVSPPHPGCLAEQWSGKKGDTAALGGKKSKKKSSRAKASGGSGSKQRKELGDPGPEEDEGVQQASPLTHSPPDEL